MKKILFSMLCIALVFSLFSCNKSPAIPQSSNEDLYLCGDGEIPKTYDSVNLLKAEKDLVTSDESVTVIKLYVNSFRYFCKHESITSIAARSQNVNKIIYMVISEDGEISYKSPYKDDGAWYWPFYSKIVADPFLYALEPNKVFDSSTIVYNTYCLLEEIGWPSQSVVCFSTNYGEYFLLCDHGGQNKLYLFSAKDFYNKLEIISEDMNEKYEENGTQIIIGNGFPNIVTHFSEEALSVFVFTPRE